MASASSTRLEITCAVARVAESSSAADNSGCSPLLVLERIERFYRREARLLDEERYNDWYDLLADDLFYWMPLRENRFRRNPRPELDPNSMALFDESKADIAVRISRLNLNLAWTEDPPTRHVYVVSNVEAFETLEGEYEIHHPSCSIATAPSTTKRCCAAGGATCSGRPVRASRWRSG